MKARPLLVLSILVAFGCEGNQSLTAPDAKSVPYDPSNVLSDGAHGGNPDFFFLPPLVPLPLNNPNFQLGTFNNTLRPGLTVEICQLKDQKNAQNQIVLPITATPCVDGDPVKKFNAGSVQLVNLPVVQNGWWALFHLPPDGFYYVLWDTRQSNLNVNKYYRIKVLVNSSILLGFADVDPMSNLSQWKYAATGEVVQMVDDVLLPIPFRVEQHALCVGATNCTSKTVTNVASDGSGFQYVKVEGGAGAIAGAKFPDNWLPAGYSNVVVTISEFPSAESTDGQRTRTIPCHADIASFQQFNGCFTFTTTPEIPRNLTTGKAFLKSVTAAVCYTLEGTLPPDPRMNFAELYASGPGEAAHALDDVSDAGILGAGSRNCNTVPVIGSANSNPLVRFASTGWRRLKGGLGQLFGVKTAYAVDVGLGGLLDAFSNVGAAIPAQIQKYESPDVNLTPDVTTTIVSARMVGSHVHDGEGKYASAGINGMRVAFSVTPANGTLRAAGSETAVQGVPATTSRITIPAAVALFVDGVASVEWRPPTTPGTYHMTANGPGTGGPITYTATVAALPDLFISSGPITLNVGAIASTGGNIQSSNWTVKNQGAGPSTATGIQYYVSTDATITTADRFIGGSDLPALAPGATASFDGPTFPINPPLTVGTYYIGILVDNSNQVAESNEGNNSVSAPFEVKPAIDFETYPPGAGVCDGAAACPVTNEFASLGVVFSSDVNTASLCQTTHGPVGEGSNYGITTESANCTGWSSATMTMSFASHPTTIEFQLGGPNGAGQPFDVSASDAAGNPLTLTLWYSFAYQDQFGNTFRRETLRVTSPNGIATITVPSISAVRYIDNLWITQ
jgi:hypothetical protein